MTKRLIQAKAINIMKRMFRVYSDLLLRNDAVKKTEGNAINIDALLMDMFVKSIRNVSMKNMEKKKWKLSLIFVRNNDTNAIGNNTEEK